MLFKIPKICVLAALCFVVAGCTSSPVLTPLEAVSVIGTDKTLGDQIISYTSGKDCSSVRVEQGKTYCVEDEPPNKVPKVYCYRTLGQVSCYEQADPYGQGNRDVEMKHENPYRNWRH